MDRGRAPGDRLAVLRGLEPSPDLVGLAGSESRRRDLVGLVLEQLEPARQLARVELASSASAARLARQRSTASAIAARSCRVPAERVEQVALPALVEQSLLIVLAVDLDERPDLVGEPRRGRRDRRPAGPSTGRRPRPRGRRSAAPAAGRTAPRPAPSRRRGGRAPVSARARSTRPSASISRLLPAPVSPVMTLRPGRSVSRRRSISARSVTVSSSRRPAHAARHPAFTTAAARPCGGSRSQNGCAPSGSTSRIGRSNARTSTTSPTAIGMSSRPSTETSAS